MESGTHCLWQFASSEVLLMHYCSEERDMRVEGVRRKGKEGQIERRIMDYGNVKG